MRHETGTTFTVRPGSGSLWKEVRSPGRIALMVVALIGLAVELAAGWYSFEQDESGTGVRFVLAMVALLVVTCVAVCVYSVLFFRNTRLVLTPGELVHRNWRGRTRRMPRDRIAGVTKARYLTDTGGVPDADILTVIADRDGRTISFGSGYWPQEELAELWRRLGAPCEQWLSPDTPSMKEFRRHHRLRLPLYHAHFQGFTMLVGTAVTLPVIALVVVVVFAVG
ncbi:hypothetical protein [Nocardiopsis aegyptia]|uniref:PH domain-containing protein n=1 Tax=Nocardiopsis aegyptia TaxID=220378 RepID=A0A7Z0J8F1_9ACTN|nr:hypothetical protein [Nocardiopsis aegyptia]NYJ32911.1 hypothetical protein [Nocardiopsis aegyptia]